ncbi:MAG TPA: two-component regulator propeller domain-containing protein, partial [bacterium]|nr:two-component regulator propeller domain-containing protein [bacterium]
MRWIPETPLRTKRFCRARDLSVCLPVMLLLTAQSPSCFSQSPFEIRHFSVVDGLAYEVVRDIAQASDGSIWFATWGRGISHFDGIHWETYDESKGLPGNDVRALHIDQNQGVWAGTTQGIGYYNGSAWSVVSATVTDATAPSVFCFVGLPDNRLWVGVEKGWIFQFRSEPAEALSADPPPVPKGEWSVVLSPDRFGPHNIRSILRTRNGEIWAALDGLGIAVYDGAAWELRWTESDLNPSILSLAQAADGSVWSAGADSFYLGADEFALLEPIRDWIRSDDKPFLLTVMCSVTHDPYEVPSWYGEMAGTLPDRYRQTIAYTDKFIQALDVELASLGLADDTIFCVVGDHGEAFGEHRIHGHERVAYE